MRVAVRWLSYIVGVLVLLALLAAAWVWIASTRALAAKAEPKQEQLAAPTPAQLADSERQARTLGCFSCHGEGLRGNRMFHEPGVGTIWAPNLTLVAARASDQELARALRQGIGVDGRSLFIMPSESLQHLSDGETAALVALVRRLPRGGDKTPGNHLGPLGRIGIATGKFRTAPAIVSEYATREPIRLGAAYDAGHRLAVTKCSECHGADLTGRELGPDEKAPDLVIAGAYDLAAFRTLLRTGKAAGNRELGLMSTVARNDFSHLNDAEIEQLHAYLQARAQK